MTATMNEFFGSGSANFGLEGNISCQASVFKYGAAGSNTQIGIHNQAQMGSATAALISPVALTLAENLPILVAVTGNATTTATDISLSLFELNACN